ncbi:30S ribosomal protein S16 [Coxiella endosymbiont of Ornithodoros amblus]|nr:30S ribosomal protein S16 [Coxiella endosymbiont of Ornithodoros amblus]
MAFLFRFQTHLHWTRLVLACPHQFRIKYPTLINTGTHMVVIRLARRGNKKNPFYHIVVADRRKPRDGRFIERVGYYNPMARGQDIRLQLEKERISHWLNQGAQTSLRVKHLIKKIKKSPEEAQKAGMRKGEFKRLQAEQAAKAQKKAVATEEPKAEETKEAPPAES